MNTLQRIKQFIDYKGISVRQFEINIGISNGSFASQLKNNKTIGVDKIENILNIYSEISPDWLLTGQGSMLRDFHEDNRYVKNNSVVGGNLSGNGNNINQNNTAELIDELRAQLLAKDKQIERLLAIIDKMSATD